MTLKWHSKWQQNVISVKRKCHQKWHQNHTKITPKWRQNDIKMTSIWHQNDIKKTSKWHQNDTKMPLKWLKNDTRMTRWRRRIEKTAEKTPIRWWNRRRRRLKVKRRRSIGVGPWTNQLTAAIWRRCHAATAATANRHGRRRRRWRRYVDGGTEDEASARRRRGHRRRAGGGGGRGRRRGASTVLPPDGGGGGARHQPSIQLNSPTPKRERKCQLQKSLHVDWLNELKETWQRWMKLNYFNSYRILKEVDGAAATGNERRRETDGERLISINLHKFASVGRDGNKRAIASFTGSFPSFTSQPFRQCSQIRRKSN